ncbi:ParB/RepB/Spo0J family partition protein [Elioraea thermophila]|uniref:ParB/RepB/Spo0J family partition protein n=1 Tax=Elioraea thermophila TaxID=2185104 RepID=UPI000DF43319|nr:ParB/RepB/Spo0J family partition protein [Elioraea thermophila]
MTARDGAPKRLGRGLAALLGEPAATAPVRAPTGGDGDIRTVPITALEPSPFQPRSTIRQESLEELIASIRERGVLQPLLVRPHPSLPDRFQIVAGERRWRAAQAVPLHEVPVLVRRLDDREAAAAALVENLQRTDLDPIEEAEGLRRLIETHSITQDEAGRMIGKSRAHVANTLRLLGLPKPVQVHLREGRLTAGHARALLAAADPVPLAERVIAEGLSVRQTEALAASGSKPATSTRAEPARDPNLASLEQDLQDRLGLAVRITSAGKGGEVRIRYRTLDELDGLLALLMREP